MAARGGLKTIAYEENEDRFGFVFAVSGPGKLSSFKQPHRHLERDACTCLVISDTWHAEQTLINVEQSLFIFGQINSHKLLSLTDADLTMLFANLLMVHLTEISFFFSSTFQPIYVLMLGTGHAEWQGLRTGNFTQTVELLYKCVQVSSQCFPTP